ncbi:hypothetical protein CONLIGDRAFT_567048 [Coniochaeta ligniaria NRRL 30616]|uniref:Zn(2)-C6 fungal-type domain-containing protein n=1 Tax=Coniochaeta ligniaria NRRL 30616 TaxID=1408157 RepID=A0A1J7K194_9PEZI|nr:hypothetical protein CONLIGDRAFT_567048 [Coniochaeta ligniaria NRRL 30616]
MRKSHRHAAGSAVPLLKTCNTCFKGKIRCDRSEESGPCNRCLRLGKECVFPPRRQNHTEIPHQQPRRLPPDSRVDARAALNGHAITQGASVEPLLSQPAVLDDFNDPLELVRGWLDAEREEQLFGVFRTRVAPRFPFVIVPERVKPQDMHQQRPCTHLAILAVASFEDFVLQRKLSSLLNRVIAAKMAAGKLVSLDVLQGLLLHLACIICDLRLDQPRRQQFWAVDTSDEGQSAEWDSDELRALVGTYYLASSSSIIVQKRHYFPYTDFILESCETLDQRGEYPSDKYLRHIVQLQRLLEQAENTIRNAKSTPDDADDINANISSIRDQMDSFKSNLAFSLSDCPVLGLQLNVLELLLSQQSLPGLSAGGGLLQQMLAEKPHSITDLLSESILASKSVISTLLASPPGYEKVLSNLEWIVLSWSLSLPARLDVLAASPPMSHLTRNLRRRLDFRHTLRQILLRLQSLVSPLEDSVGDRDIFYHFLRRARGVEAWYLRHSGLDSLLTPGSIDVATSHAGSASNRGAEANPTFPGNASEPGNLGTADLFFVDLVDEGMQDVDFGLFLGMQDFDLF